MPKKQEILYVAYWDESIDESFSYAMYLSNMLGEPLRIVLLNPDGLGKKFDDAMSATTLAKAGEPETAREMLGADDETEAGKIQNYLMEKCQSSGIEATVHTGLDATATVVMNFLRNKKIDMVLLSPEVTNSKNILKKLVKYSPRPVITMANGASEAKAS